MLSDPPEVYVACEECGGEGHTLHSRYGGNDPDVWAIPCRACNGAGGMICDAAWRDQASVALGPDMTKDRT